MAQCCCGKLPLLQRDLNSVGENDAKSFCQINLFVYDSDTAIFRYEHRMSFEGS